jgi:NADPH:quinone reductase-like Zn-dependent oxidoreductase
VVLDGDDLGQRVRDAAGGAKIKLAIDAVAGEACIRLADCLADGGTLVNYGLLSGKPCMLTGLQGVFRGIALTVCWLAKFLTTAPAAEKKMLYEDLLQRVADGSLHVDVEATYAIEDIKEALAHAGREGRGGKVLVTPNGPVS